MSKRSKPTKRTIAFLFPGQGSQYAEMGRSLYETQPTFRSALDRCDEILRPLLGASILSVLYLARMDAEHPNAITTQSVVTSKTPITDTVTLSPCHLVTLSQTVYTQPALFAIEYALAQLWQSWGVQPHVVMGHSVGEYVAACVAGVFSLEDGLRLIAARGRLMGALPAGGVMVAVHAGEAQVSALLAQSMKEQLAIAAINGPESVVISGDSQAINGVVAQLQAQGIKTKTLEVSHASHSPLMEPMLADFAEVTRQVTFALPQRPFISNLTGTPVDEAITQPAYWVQHIRRPVRFADGMKSLQAFGANTFVEIGPKTVLLGMGRLCLSQPELLWLPSLRMGQADWETMFESLGALYKHGVAVDWQGVEQDYQPARRRVALPTYPFERQRYWIEPQPLVTTAPAPADAPTPTDLAGLKAHLTPLLLAQVEQSAFNQRVALHPHLEALSLAYIVTALTNLGLVWRVGQRWSSAQLAAQLAVVPRHHRLLARLCALLGAAGILQQVGDQWVIRQAPSSTTPEQLRATLPVGVAEAELALLTHCGPRLAAVLCGQEDPLMVLFPGGDSRLVAQFYQETREARVMNHLVGQAVERFVATQTGKAGLRLLEIGAGTGGTTRFVLPHLPVGQTQYTFTDVGRSFLKRAQETFQEYNFIQYQLLDIEQEPGRQGFADQQYDVVIAANVLHATADLRQTVRHVRQLLKPGGWLVLRETTRQSALLDLTFGLTEGWWRFADLALRPNHALLSPTQWGALLQQTAFQAVTYLPEASQGTATGDETLIVARANAVPLALPPVEPATTATNGQVVAPLLCGDSMGAVATSDHSDPTQAVILQQLALMQQQLLTWHAYTME